MILLISLAVALGGSPLWKANGRRGPITAGGAWEGRSWPQSPAADWPSPVVVAPLGGLALWSLFLALSAPELGVRDVIVSGLLSDPLKPGEDGQCTP